jgi:hypothetical protein
MPKFTEAAGRTIASDVTSTFESLDVALLNAARLTVSMMEGQMGSALAPSKGQHVLNAVVSGMNRVVEGRRDMVSAHMSLIAIKNGSNLDVVDLGCTEGPLFRGPASAVSGSAKDAVLA